MYILKTDYKTRISTSLLDLVIKETTNDTGEDLLATVSKIAEDTIITKTGMHYDIVPEMAKTGNARNFMIVSLALSISVYEVYQRIDDEQVPEKVIKNFNDAMNYLDEVSQAKKALNLPTKPTEEGEGGSSGAEGAETDGSGLRRIGSQPKRTHQV